MNDILYIVEKMIIDLNGLLYKNQKLYAKQHKIKTSRENILSKLKV